MSKLPPLMSRCDICSNESRADGDGPLLRCSVCKDRFYCSSACQSQDWKEHKYSCSVCSPEEFELGHVQIEKDIEREETIKKYTALLQTWTKEHKAIKNSSPGGQLRFGSGRGKEAGALMSFTFPEKLQYKRHPTSRSKYPYRSTLMLATRAGLIQLISKLSLAERELLSLRIDRAKIPTNWTRLFGPKVICRSANLSPGEYEVMGTLGSTFLLQGKRDELEPIAKLPMEDKDFWFMLAEAFKELWDAPRDLVYDA